MRAITAAPSPGWVKVFVLSLCLLAVALSALPTWAYETDVQVRDPSTVVKRNGTYWVYGTGMGVQQFSSTDRVHWKFQGPVFPTAPAWVAQAVPKNTHNNAWAPDVRYFGGQWHLYFCYSTIGSKVSVIGTATNPTLDPRSWTDGGIVVRTGDDTDCNALDPCVFQDADGTPWLSFGSYFSGIKLVKLDTATGKPAPSAAVTSLATRPGTPGNAIEASAVTFHDGYYYLFVNWDSCCVGAKSTYNIRMGRSQAVSGPYLDRDGKDMRQDGGTLFLGSLSDNGSGRLCDDEVGPGHFGLLHDTDGDWVSFHEEWARDKGGATTVNLLQLAWDSDGWPRAVLDPGPDTLISNLATHDLATVARDAGKPLQTQPVQGSSAQKWTLHYQGDGYYSLISGANRQALTVADAVAKPGSKVTVAPFAKRDSQLWLLRQNDNGTDTLLPKNGGLSVALDVGACSPADGAAIGIWTANGLVCQEWSFHKH